MYILKSAGETAGFCEEPRYIKVNPNSGCYVQANAGDAQGIAFLGTPYNLPGHTEITREVFVPTEGGEEGEGTIERQVAPEVEVERVDNYQFLKGLADKDVSQDEDIAETQMALCNVSDNVAQDNYPVGAYLMYNNKLYTVTRAIARTERVVVGYNVEETNIMSELIKKTEEE